MGAVGESGLVACKRRGTTARMHWSEDRTWQMG